MLIYVLEDERSLNDLMAMYLKREGYSVCSFYCGNDAVAVINDPCRQPDLWIIDIMLPDIDGFTVFNKILECTPNVQTIFISARNQEIDRVVGLELGCDDYISKPFMARELVIRVNRLLKTKKETNILNFGAYEIHKHRHKVLRHSDEIDFSIKEYHLLLYLIENQGLILSREQIIQAVWDSVFEGSTRVVDDTIRRIRRKIPELKIETIYGFGYILEGISQ